MSIFYITIVFDGPLMPKNGMTTILCKARVQNITKLRFSTILSMDVMHDERVLTVYGILCQFEKLSEFLIFC